MKPFAPHFYKAVYDWMIESGNSPQVLVNSAEKGVQLPQNAVINSDGTILLNVFPNAVRDYVDLPEGIAFRARFGGVSGDVFVPYMSILLIGCKELDMSIPMMEMATLEDVEPEVVKEEVKVARPNHLKVVK